MPLQDLTNSPLKRPGSRTSSYKHIASPTRARVGTDTKDGDNNGCSAKGPTTQCALDAAIVPSVDEASSTNASKATSSGYSRTAQAQIATALPKGGDMKTILERYREFLVVGSGTFGLVVVIVDKNTGTDYVVKRVPWPDGKLPRDENGDVVPPEEYQLLRKLPTHPNVIRAFEWYHGKKHAFMVLEPFGPNWHSLDDGSWRRTEDRFIQPSDLFSYLNDKTRPTLSQRDFQKIASQIVKAVHHLAQHNIVHRDLKTENVLINGSLQVKLVDFGLATTARPDEWRSELVGTVEAWPPEMLCGSSYQGHHLAAAEVYMLGGILLELCQKQGARHRFHDQHVRDILHNSYAKGPSAEWSMTGWDDCRDLIVACLNDDPKLRPTIAELAQDYVIAHWDEGYWQVPAKRTPYPFYTPRHLRATTQRTQTQST